MKNPAKATRQRWAADKRARAWTRPAYVTSIDPRNNAKYSADESVRIVIRDTLQMSPNGRTVIYADVVILDNFSAKRQFGVNQGPSMPKYGRCFRVLPDGTRLVITKSQLGED